MTVTSKKLIEVALPLEAINAAAAREKSIRHGHPSTLHLWWARRPLAAARAVIFAQMVDDPSGYIDELRGDDKLRRKAERELTRRRTARDAAVREYEQATRAGLTVSAPGPEPTLDDILAELERDRLFKIIEELVVWENTTNEKVLDRARAEIWQSWRRTCARNADHPRAAELFNRNKLPAFHDPFAGGGALPLEAQRLGLEAYASDLNPVAVLINKAMIEIPPKFAGRPPVHPPEEGQAEMPREWKGAQGLAEDVRYYGKWMRDEAEKRIGHLYPKVEITPTLANERPDLKPYIGKRLTTIAWIWARTVRSPNPAYSNIEVPLAATFVLSKNTANESWIHPVLERQGYQFVVKAGKSKASVDPATGTKLNRANFRCLMSGATIGGEYIKEEAKAGRMGSRLMAVVALGDRERVYLSPTQEDEQVALSAEPTWAPDVPISGSTQYVGVKPYGMETFSQLYSARQLSALSTLSDLVSDVRRVVFAQASDKGKEWSNDSPDAYADAVALYLALAVGKLADNASTLCSWHNGAAHQKIRSTFGRQALPMTWDYAEGNPFSDSSGNFLRQVDLITEVLQQHRIQVSEGHTVQQDAQEQTISEGKVISTDPPYYDNVPYADLSDYFYVWLRRSLRNSVTDSLATIAVPKEQELVAFAYRHGDKRKADRFFLEGMTKAMTQLSQHAHEGFPISVYYAFKQTEQDDDGTVSTGWETFLDAVTQAGYSTTGTWPVRTELANRMRGMESNALATSVVLACTKRDAMAGAISRREFVAALKREIPAALRLLQSSNIAPVDLAQAAIGPGMAIFTRYDKVLHSEGHTLTTHEALAQINQVLDELLTEQEGDFDADTRWALAWYDEYGFDEGEYGRAETLSKAKNTSVAGMVQAGIVASSRGKVRLLKPEELPVEWEPDSDVRLTAWEVLHHLVRVLDSASEGAAAELAHTLGSQAEIARELAYRLYNVCERRKRAADALSYNALVQSWPEIMRLAHASHAEEPEQGRLL